MALRERGVLSPRVQLESALMPFQLRYRA